MRTSAANEQSPSPLFLVTSDDKLVAFTDSSKPAPRSGDTVIGLLAATRRAADESSDSSALKA